MENAKESKNIIKKIESMSLGLYFVILTIVLIILTATAMATFMLLSVRNLAGEYESDASKLRFSIVSILVDTIKTDIDNNNFTKTKRLISGMERDDILSFVLIKNTKTNDIIIDKQNMSNIVSTTTVNNKTLYINDYEINYGIPEFSKSENIFVDFGKLMFNALIFFISISVIMVIFLSRTITNPLKKLSNAAKKITEGDFNIKLENTKFSEINELINAYNEMAFQLNELYSSLELKVQERTIALEAANYKLQETQAMMVHSEKMRSLGELVAGIAHEINNPINFIHGNIMILKNYSDDLLNLISLYEQNDQNLPENLKASIQSLKNEIDLDFLKTDINDLIKSCIEGTERTKNIVLDLKNFSRMEEMVLTQFDISKEIDTTLNILNNKYKNRITVEKNYSPEVPKIEAYGGQLNQVFMNILDNAQDAMEEQGKLIINTSLDGNKNVKIEFIDNGKGIPEENLKKVFDPFFTTKAVGKGTGLGMSISYRVINDHKGKINVESKVGEGTKFTIILPVTHEDEQNEILVEKTE